MPRRPRHCASMHGRTHATPQVFALCEALYDDQLIVSLDLSYNNLNDMAAQALSRLLKVRLAPSSSRLCFGGTLL